MIFCIEDDELVLVQLQGKEYFKALMQSIMRESWENYERIKMLDSK